MSWLLLNFHNWMNGTSKYKEQITKSEKPLRFGVLGAAAINFSALFEAVESHPDAVIHAIAARTLKKAEEQIEKYKLKTVRAYGSYDELLRDPDVDAVYIPLPNGLHTEWTLKSLRAGKNVLVEKPISSNAHEALSIQKVAKESDKIALEAFHWRFHPAAHTVRALIDSGKYGRVMEVNSTFRLFAPVIPADDIRFNFDLAGGASLDLSYVYSSVCYFCGIDNISSAKFEVHNATARPNKNEKRIDEAMDAVFSIRDSRKPEQAPVKATSHADLAVPKLFGLFPKFWAAVGEVSIELERAKIKFENFPGPWLFHVITIQEKDAKTGRLIGKKETKKCYKDGPLWSMTNKKTEEWWTTYRYQLEGFVEMVRLDEAGKSESYLGPWVGLDESVKVMELIDAVVEKAGLPVRGKQ